MEGCYLLLGENDWAKEKYVNEVKKKLSLDQNDMMNYLEAKDREVNVSHLIDFAETLPFFTDKKLMVIKDTGLFKPGKKDETEKFEAFLKQIPDYMVILIDEIEVDKRGKLYKTIKAQHHIEEFNFPGEDAVYELLNSECLQKQLQVEPHVLRYFIRNMPQNMAYIFSEWEKLLGYIETSEITKTAINEICVFSLEQRVFELVKKIANHEANAALEIYSRMIQSKESPIGILVLIGRQYRMMLQTKYLILNRKGPKEIAAALKIPFFAVKEMTEQVNGYSFKALEKIVETCLETDKGIKTGQMEASKCVELLIMRCLNE